MAKSRGTYAERFGEEFQIHILAVMARIPGCLLRYWSAFSPSYFDSDLLRLVATGLSNHVQRYKTIPTAVTLQEEVRGLTDEATMEAVSSFIRRLWKRDIGDHAAVTEKAVEFGKLQSMVNAVLKGAEQINNGKPEAVLQLVKEAQTVGQDLLEIGVNYCTSLDQRLKEYIDPEEEEEAIPTGIRHVDEGMGGGLGRGELGVVLAPPKRGKSTTLVNFAFGACRSLHGYKVAYYSCEMRQKRITRRFDARLAGTQYAALAKTDPHRFTEVLRDRMSKFIHGNLFVKHYPTRSLTPSMLRSHLMLLQAHDFHPDMIVVDYADIMRPERRLGEMRHEQAGLYEDLREIAGEFDAAVWTASQAKSVALDKASMDISDFAEAFEKAAIIDAGIAFMQTLEERADNRCRLGFIALRNQEDQRVVECAIDRRACLIRSTAIYDAMGTRVMVSGDDEENSGTSQPSGEAVTRMKLAVRRERKAENMGGPKRRKANGPRRRLSAE